jgi:hypothetical protein
VSLPLSGQVIEAYKAKGPGWQSRIDADLRRINKIKRILSCAVGLREYEWTFLTWSSSNFGAGRNKPLADSKQGPVKWGD